MIYRAREGMEPGEPVLAEITLAELAAAYRDVLRRAERRARKGARKVAK